MFTLMIGLSATGIAAGLGLGMGMARKKSQQQQNLMRSLGIPEDACSTVNTQWQRVLRELAATEARIRERSPHLSAAQRLELAADLVRARGLIPLAERREH